MPTVKKLRALLTILSLLVSHSLFAQTETPVTVPASFFGTYETFFDSANSRSPYLRGDKVTLVISSDNSLCVNGLKLSDPVFVNGKTTEAVWRDTANSVEYHAGNFTSGYDGITVRGPNRSAFYGQLVGSKVSDSTFCDLTSSQVKPVANKVINEIFALAESKLPTIFPSGAVTLTFEKYLYRFYSSTSVYLAFAGNAVYLLGGSFGDVIVNIGAADKVLASLEALEVEVTTGGGSGSATLWNLSISGSLNTPFVQNVAFSGIAIPNVPAPNLNNTNEVNDEIVNSLAGIASGIGSISITVVNNSDARRTFDVNFNATLPGLGAVTYNLRYDYTR